MFRVIFIFLAYFTNVEITFASTTKEVVLNLIKEKIMDSVAGQEFEVKLTNFSTSMGKSSKENIEVSGLELDDNQRGFRVQVKFEDGKEHKLMGRVVFQTEIPALKRIIKPGDIIEEGDITWMKYEADRVTNTMVTQKTDLVGKTARNMSLKTNTPIHENNLQKPVVVHKGQAVQVVYRSQNFTVSNTAHAQVDGALGDVIAFEVITNNDGQGNTPKKKVIHAKVVGPSSAEVLRGA